MLQIDRSTSEMSWQDAQNESKEIWDRSNEVPRPDISEACAKAICHRMGHAAGPGWALLALEMGLGVPYKVFADDMVECYNQVRRVHSFDSPEYLALVCLGQWAYSQPGRDD